MKITLRFLSIVLLGLISLNGFGQTRNYKKGTVTLSNGEIQPGFILYRNWKQTPYNISFKKSIADQAKTLDTTTIKGFEINDNNIHELFELHRIKVDTSAFDQDLHVRKTDTAQIAEQNLFMRCIRKGSISFYKINIADVDLYYISKNNETPTELVYRKFLNDNNHISLRSTYIYQLGEYLTKCKDINQQQLNSVNYTQSDLLKLIDKCTELNQTFVEKSFKIPHSVGVLTGISYSKTKYYGDATEFASFNNKLSPYVGIFADIMIDRRVKRFSLYNELAYKTINSSDDKSKYQTSLFTTQQTYHVNLGYLKLYNLLRYYFPFNNHHSFINGGLSTALLLNSKQTKTEYNTLRNEATKELIYPEQRKYEQGLAIGAGISFKKLKIEGRMEISNGNSPYLTRKNSFSSFFAIISYSLIGNK